MTRTLRSLVLSGLSLGALVAAAAWRQDRRDPGPAPVPAQAKSAFQKGNLHTHTLRSDGDDFPEMVADWYKRHGYHFLSLTDHNVLSDAERWVD